MDFPAVLTGAGGPEARQPYSALTKGRTPCRDDAERTRVLRFERLDLLVALGLAGIINMAMLAAAARLFHNPPTPRSEPSSRTTPASPSSPAGWPPLPSPSRCSASGVSSSSVGTYAGQLVMQGFTRLNIPLMLRRAITMAPAIILLASASTL